MCIRDVTIAFARGGAGRPGRRRARGAGRGRRGRTPRSCPRGRSVARGSQRPAGMRGLGIDAVFYDPAAALVVDGTLVAVADEERFTRRKHGKPPAPFATWELPTPRPALPRRGAARARPRARAVRAPPRGARRLGVPGRAVPGLERARPRRARRAGLAPRGAVRGGPAGGARRPGAAPLARAALRAGHRAPRLPAGVRRVRGDGAHRLRRAALARRAAPRDPRHGRRRLPHRGDALGAVRAAAAPGRPLGAGARGPRRERPAAPRGGARCWHGARSECDAVPCRPAPAPRRRLSWRRWSASRTT